MPPPITTPIKAVGTTCHKPAEAWAIEGPECGATLLMTGKPTTFADAQVPGVATDPHGRASTRRARTIKNWVPAMLVTICPVCDTGPEPVEPPPAEAAPVETETDGERAVREAYLHKMNPNADTP